MNPRPKDSYRKINLRAVSKYLAGRIEIHTAEIAASSTEYAERPTEAFFIQLKVLNVFLKLLRA